ncbi:MAG: hypothetical protein ACKO2L_06035 [Planctomycetaceae bacterium]
MFVLALISVPSFLLACIDESPSRAVPAGSGVVADLPDGESDYIFELRSRGLFDLGRQVCLQRLAAAKNLTLQARWELQFIDCCEDEAWLLPQSRREELISLAASRITDFLNRSAVQPDTELALRLRQLELLAAAADMECTAIAFRSSLPAASRLQFARSACTQGIQLATAQLKFADELRSTLPPATLRDIRFRLRCSLLELQLSEHRLTHVQGSGDSRGLSAVRSGAEQLVRGLADQHLFRARHLLALVLLDSGDDAALELQLRNLAANVSSTGERLRLEVLHQTRLLRLRRPSELSARISQPGNPLPADILNIAELRLLQLHARLMLCELLSEIELNRRPGDRSLAEAETAFQTLKAELSPQLRGVWQERLQYCERRLELVLLAGPVGADAIEAVSALLAANDTPAALSRLEQITRLPAVSRELKALAGMQIGELLLRESRWGDAIGQLEAAAADFAVSGRRRQQAAADLLRLYGLARQHPDTSPYLDALNHHISTFADQPTVDIAREYRARLLRFARPLDAAGDLLAIPAPKSDATPETVRQHLRKLALVGDCLLEASLATVATQTIGGDDDGSDTGANTPPAGQPAELIATATAQLQPWLEQVRRAESPEQTIISLQILSAPLLLSEFRSGKSEEDWNSINAELVPLLVRFPTDVALPQSPGDRVADKPTDDSFDFAAVAARTRAAAETLRLLAASRLLLPATEIQKAEAILRGRAVAVRREQVLLLLPHLSRSGLPGNASLASFATELLPPANAADRTAADLLRDLPVQLRLQQCGGPGEPAAAILGALIRQPLTPSQLQRAARILSGIDPAVMVGVAASPSPTVADFWRKVQKQTKSGEPAWLEASLQLASLAAVGGRVSEAQRILRTVSVLHPSWGDSERQTRAVELLKSLERR